jgi:hypothetical protein
MSLDISMEGPIDCVPAVALLLGLSNSSKIFGIYCHEE